MANANDATRGSESAFHKPDRVRRFWSAPLWRRALLAALDR